MKVCLVGSILRHRVITKDGEYIGWGGMTESAIAPFAALLDKNSKIYFIGNVGKPDIKELKAFFRERYPFVDTSGIGINPTGTDFHYGTKDYTKVSLRVEPTRYEQIEPYLHDADVAIFNFGNVDDIDPEAIKKVKQNSKALVYVDVHRKPFAADKEGRIYTRGWLEWREYLPYADVVQMNRIECAALFNREVKSVGDAVQCAKIMLDAGVPQAFVTLRGQGVLVAQRSPSYRYALAPAIPAKVVDLTGCGDAFAAGYVVAATEGKPVADAVKMGSALASINCEFMGYMKNTNRKSVEKRMRDRFAVTELDPKNLPPIQFV